MLSSPNFRNTSSTPDQPGRWVVTEFGPPSVLAWTSFDPYAELAKEGPDKVLVRIIAAGIAGSDNIQRVGGYPDPRSSEPGFTPGYDFVGEIVKLGDSVPEASGLLVGDRVASMCVVGAHATHKVISYTELIRISADDDPVKTATLPLNYMTAWGMLKRSGVDLGPGSSILLGAGAGGLGTAAAQLVASFGMKIRILCTCSTSKFDYVKSLGMEPIDRRSPGIAEQVRTLTNGEGVDVAYDPIGSAESLRNSHRATKDDVGRLVTTGVMSEIVSDGSGLKPQKNGGFLPAQILASRQQPRMSFFAVSGDYYQKSRNVFNADFYNILEKVRTGHLDPIITKKFRLSDAVKANEELVSGNSVMGRMVFIADEAVAFSHGL